MRKYVSFLLLAIVITWISGCGPSRKASTVEVIASWVNKEEMPGKKANSVFITVLTQNMATRSLMERDLSAAATAHGIKPVQSLSMLTPVTGVPDSVLMGAFVRTVDKSGCNTVLLVSLLDSRNETKYVPGSSYSYEPYAAYGLFYPTYYASTFNTISTPGYYISDNTYYIESNLYDVASQKILFSIQTKAVNPDDIDKASKRFTETLMDEIKANGMLKGR